MWYLFNKQTFRPVDQGQDDGLLLFCINSLHAELFRKNINMFLQFLSFLHTDMTQVVEILHHVRKGLIYST